MKYKGRICTMIFLVITESIYIIYYYSKFGYIDTIQKIMIPILILITWFLGKKFDEVKFYSQEVNDNREELNQICDSTHAALWSYDVCTNSTLVVMGIEKTYGLSRKRFLDNPMVWQEIVYQDDIKLVKEHEKELLLGKSSHIEYRFIKEDGEVRWMKNYGIPIFDSSGKVIKINVMAIDITEQKLTEEKYKKLEENYSNLIEIAPIGIAIHEDEKLMYVNSSGARILNIDNPQKLINKSIFDIIHPKFHQATINRVNELKENKIHTRLNEYKLFRSEGKTVDAEMISTSITYSDKPAILTMIIDVTERKKSEEKIKQLAFYDSLTGLPNRNMLDYKFNKLLDSSKVKKQNVGVMFLDLDRFKIINDTMGHTFGDIILQQFSKRLVQHVHKDDMICRYGGDEFIILLNDTNQIEATKVAQSIIDEFSYPFIINEQKFFLSTSIGISLYSEDRDDLETLIKCADIAMFVAKQKGKNNYKFYISGQSNDISKKMYLENELRQALENNEFILYYQPQFNLHTGKIVGMEALIRWKHPELGLISPDEFIPLAEETGLIIPIGEWVIKTACKQNKSWQESGLPSIYIAVNISAYQFQQNNFVENIKKVLKETKLDPQYLELEMTESIMQNIEQLTVVLNELKNIGIQLSLDDFGTGYSSLNVLRRLPIDTLKIDKSFVDDIISDVNTAPIVKTIIDMGRNLKLNVIAEGIENKEQVDFLKQNKCNVGQGYFFSRPLPAEDIIYCLEIN